jgi:RNA 2',3'-cyclic 3'-phosphodiesterase
VSPRGERWIDPFAGMPGRRLFIAVPLPDDAAEAVRSVVDEVRAEPLPPGARDVRWVRLDGLHLTVRFLGPTPEDRVEATAAAVRAVASAAAGPIAMELGGAGTFPPQGRPRALWLGIVQGADALGDLATQLDSALAAAGWPSEHRPFRAHLTLARSDGIAVGRLVADRLASAMSERHIPVLVDQLGLFESVTGGGAARYVPVASAQLGAMPR